jgi:hypothetical protein
LNLQLHHQYSSWWWSPWKAASFMQSIWKWVPALCRYNKQRRHAKVSPRQRTTPHPAQRISTALCVGLHLCTTFSNYYLYILTESTRMNPNYNKIKYLNSSFFDKARVDWWMKRYYAFRKIASNNFSWRIILASQHPCHLIPA